ncbi:alpha-L-glutamate ligase [Cryobacterium frigoriphilum]|uniref:Alpha-L-glutamate ligase n=1 Tax=Cryobacterium frigoriphilum TaxID=1259150 RepID=A0A4R9A8P4_9MICO|nr:alpha-L-glutamate ligase [Cryobacterium frigoriphilum]TFD53964.1 alpha-L-glutamate ligase [Cryobacterium frigoriphilum]
MTFLAAATPVVYIVHENNDWMPPLLAGFEAEGVPYREWMLDAGSIDLTQAPPEGVFWSRLSASSHTRGHAHAKEYARSVLRWLEAHGRRVINGTHVVELEVSKVAQYVQLGAAGFDVPATIAVFGVDDLGARARELALPFITKHNQGGKGLGVRRFDSYTDFDAYVAGADFEVPIDGVTLLQEYVLSAEPFITRAEFVGGRFVYAVRVDTSAGSFELCPADACVVEPAPGLAPAVCAVPGAGASLFTRRDEIEAGHPLIVKIEAFLAEHGIEVAGVEFIETADGRFVTYDVNTNTNYNPDVEAGLSEAGGARSVARFLGGELAARYSAD